MPITPKVSRTEIPSLNGGLFKLTEVVFEHSKGSNRCAHGALLSKFFYKKGAAGSKLLVRNIHRCARINYSLIQVMQPGQSD